MEPVVKLKKKNPILINIQTYTLNYALQHFKTSSDLLIA